MNQKQMVLLIVLFITESMLLFLYILILNLFLLGVMITVGIALIVAIVTLGTEPEYNPKMVIGEPPSKWPVGIGLRKIMGERIGYARLANQREMMAIGPMSSLRLNPYYHYRLVKFANYAGLYRVQR